MFKKLKSLLLTDQWFYGIIILLVGVLSFLLGRVSVVPAAGLNQVVKPGQEEVASVQVASKEITNIKPAIATSTKGTAVVASKSGTKYHLPTCPGAKQIKEENKLFFANTEEAEAAGYKRAANCP